MLIPEGGHISLAASNYEKERGEKDSAIAGPLGDIFNTPFAIVTGTISDDPAMKEMCRRKAQMAADFWRQWQQQTKTRRQRRKRRRNPLLGSRSCGTSWPVPRPSPIRGSRRRTASSSSSSRNTTGESPMTARDDEAGRSPSGRNPALGPAREGAGLPGRGPLPEMSLAQQAGLSLLWTLHRHATRDDWLWNASFSEEDDDSGSLCSWPYK